MTAGSTFKTIQDILRKDVGVDGDAQRIGQLAWMLFLKLLEDREIDKEAASTRYQSPIPDGLRWQSWADKEEGLGGDDLLAFVDNELFPGLKSLPGTDPLSALVRSVFEGAYNYMRSGDLLRQALDRLDDSNFNREPDRREVGDAYEHLLRDLSSAGNAGELYTPRALTEFMVERVDPKLGETILDPGCGTGGFLVSAIEHMRKKHRGAASDERSIQASIQGIEKKPLPYLLCVTNLMVHGLEARIRQGNALADVAANRKKKGFDVVFANPPFGGIEEEGIEKGFPPEIRTRETADLFLYLIMTRLRPGGRAAVVVPDGWLSGEGGARTRIKQKLLEECNLHTIVRLPKGVFNPYTSIKSNLLFFTKGEATKDVWYYEHPYPPGYKSYTKTKPLRIEEFEI
jgi:type I restriction enzyme M protein